MPADAEPLVVAINYHRIGPVDPANPFHRLHTVATDVFEAQIAALQSRGTVVSLGQLDHLDELGPVNFAVSFDDIPLDALGGIDILDRAGLPYTIAICTRLTDDGHGTRDKVYVIDQALTDQEIHELLRPRLGHLLPPPEDFSFYHFSKSAVLPHHEMEQQVIDPLLAQTGEQLVPNVETRAYLDWDQIRAVAARPGATVANHGQAHANLAALTRDEIAADVDLSHNRITAQIGHPPNYFAVPFGHVDQRVCLDLLAALHRHDYRGVLWVGKTSNVLVDQPPPTMRHIMRIQAPLDIAGLNQVLGQCTQPASRRHYLVEHITPEDHRQPIDIVDGERLDDVRSMERILRQAKPHAIDDTYFAHQFTENPQRYGRQAYQTVTRQGRAEAVLYNFHTTFSLGGTPVPGVYVSGWRRLPVSHQYASGLLLRRVVEREPIVGVYRPNPAVESAFAGWQRADFTILRIDPTTVPPLRSLDVDTTAHFPGDLDRHCESWNAALPFTVHRTGNLYRWRYDHYPLASVTHLVVRQGRHPLAYAPIVQCPGEWSISDHLEVPGSGAALHVIQAACNLATADVDGVDRVVVHVSDQDLVRALQELGAAESSAGRSYYHFNPDRLADHRHAVDVDEWETWNLHETELCGDVLPRPA